MGNLVGHIAEAEEEGSEEVEQVQVMNPETGQPEILAIERKALGRARGGG